MEILRPYYGIHRWYFLLNTGWLLRFKFTRFLLLIICLANLFFFFLDLFHFLLFNFSHRRLLMFTRILLDDYPVNSDLLGWACTALDDEFSSFHLVLVVPLNDNILNLVLYVL
jgi:hypothetical protein